MITRILQIAICAWACRVANSAFGHTIWIEPIDDKLVIRFAEPGDDFETSPGHLDSLPAPNCFLLITNEPVTMEALKKSDHFLLVGASGTNTAFVETIFTVRGGRKPHFYARWQSLEGSPGRPLLTLDLVPTGHPGEVRVYFRGQQLGGIKATLRTPDNKEQDVTADAEGLLRFKATQSGQYLLTLAHQREPLAGFYTGRPYQQTSHNAALSWLPK